MPKLPRGKVATKEVGVTLGELAADWFERDPETFIKISAEHRVEWGEESHSAFLLHGRPHGWDLLEQAYKLISSLLLAMDLPNRTTLKFHKTDSRTDGKRVFISTEVLDEISLTVEQRADILLGLAAHEGCHVKYTNFKALNEWQTRKVLPFGAQGRILFNIWNVLEDERIEQELGNDLPGMARYLVPLKKYMFEILWERRITELKEARTKEREKEWRVAVRKALDEDKPIPEKPVFEDDEEINDLNAFERFSDLFLKIIRYPKNIKVADIAYFGKYILDIRNIITPYPTTTEETIVAAEKIWEVLKAFYKAPPAAATETEDEKGGRIIIVGPGGGDGEGEPYKPHPDDILIMLTDPDSPVESSVTEDAEKLLPVIEMILKHSAEAGKDFGAESREVKTHDFKVSVLEGDAFEGALRNTFFRKSWDNEEVYKDSYRRISPYIAPLRKALALHNMDFTRTLRGQRNGYLDESKLVEAFSGSPTVYLRHQKVKTDRVVIGVLIDQSGSMGYSNMQAARDGAILLNEALSKVSNIELFVYGHTGDLGDVLSTDLYVYSEPNHRPRFALGSAVAKVQNRDGVAIMETAKRIRNFTQNNGVLFVLSDGEPWAGSYTGESAIRDTRKNVEAVHRMGLSVVQIAIEEGIPCERMFDKFVKFTDLSQLARQMGLLVRQLALQKAKIRIEG